MPQRTLKAERLFASGSQLAKPRFPIPLPRTIPWAPRRARTLIVILPQSALAMQYALPHLLGSTHSPLAHAESLQKAPRVAVKIVDGHLFVLWLLQISMRAFHEPGVADFVLNAISRNDLYEDEPA